MTVSTTARLGVTTWTSGGDPFTRLQLHGSHTALEAKAAGFEQGTTLPTAAVAYKGFFFFETDTDTLSYCDGSAWFPAVQFGAPASLAGDAVVAAGSSALSARSDHVHAMPGFATPGATGTAAAEGSATSLARSDHVHTVGTDSVTTAAIADNQVTLAKMADDSVDSAEIVDGAIDPGHLANNAVTTDAIAASQVTNAKMADNAIDTVEIVDGAVTTVKIADGQVTLAKMAINSVDSAQIVGLSIDPGHLAAGAVTTNKIGNVQVTNDKIANTTIATGKLNFTPVETVAAGAGIAVDSSTASAPSLAMNVPGLTTVLLGPGDMVAIQDVTDNTTKKVTASEIAALAEQGTVTSITPGTGLGNGSAITGTGTLNVQGLTLAQFGDDAKLLSSETWANSETMFPTAKAMQTIGKAYQWTTARTVTFLGGDVTGSFTINGDAHVNDIVLTIADDSHAHLMGDVDGLSDALDAKEDSHSHPYAADSHTHDSGDAVVATSFTIGTDGASGSRYLVYVDTPVGDKFPKVDAGLRYDPSSNELYASGVVRVGTNLQFASTTAYIKTSGNENALKAIQGGSTNLYYSNSSKLSTTATGVGVTGLLTVTDLTTTDDVIVGDDLTVSGQIDVTGDILANGNVWIDSGSGRFAHHAAGLATGTEDEAHWLNNGFGQYYLIRNNSRREDKENETTNLGDFTTGLVDQLTVTKFNRKNRTDRDEIGLISDDVDLVSEYLTNHGSPDENGVKALGGINKAAWMSLLTLAIQDIRTRLVALEA